MKLAVVFIIAVCLSVTAKVYAQTVSLNETNAPLEGIFKKIKKQTDYTFVFTNEQLKGTNKVNIKLENAPLKEALQQIFAGQPVDYTIYNKMVIIKDKVVKNEGDASLNIKEQEAYAIRGAVSDEKGVPLPGATVFLANSQKATATNDSGRFVLEQLQPGTYEVVVKMLGFGIYNKFITIQKRPIDIAVQLKENTIALSAVNIHALSTKDRKKYLPYFIRYFIGESANAEKCKLLNPEEVNLSYDKTNAVIEATSDKFLIIENRALGYRVHYLITGFKMDLPNQLLSYDGSLYFEEMQGKKSQQERWAKNRQLTYEGSIWHFFKAAFNNTIKEDGFLVYKLPDAEAANKVKATDFNKVAPLDDPGSLFTNINRNVKLFHLDSLKKDSSEIYVIYTRRGEPDEYIESEGIQLPFQHNKPKYAAGNSVQLPFTILAKLRQVTIIHPVLDSMLFDRNGNINSPKSILPRGYWAWSRVADLFPPDYNSTPVKKQPQTPAIKQIKAIVNVIDSTRNRLAIEKLYVQLDKPYYSPGDTMRFKAYLLDEALSASAKSGVMYVELLNDSSNVCKRQTIIVTNGFATGDIILKSKWYAGNYTLRAYTNWMRNFGVEHFFTHQVVITPPDDKQWLVNNRITFDKDKNVNIELHFSDINHQNISFRDMQLSILHGASVLLKNQTRTDPNGNTSIRFTLPENMGNKQLTLLAEDITKEGNGRKITIPIRFNRPENTDLQFMPEGGNLVAGIPSRIGFKAIGEDGKGVDIAGKIINSKQQEVASFQSAHNGMGYFELSPQAGETYTAKVILPGGTIKNYPLPVAEPSGVALRINARGNDTLEINLNNVPNITTAATTPAIYYLIGLARDKVCYGAKIVFRNNTANKTIMKSIFPTGIVKFVLFNESDQPVTQRMVFVDHNDCLTINVNTNRKSYAIRDSVGLQLLVTDASGYPVNGTFSLAVTDNNQVSAEGPDAENIASYMLLNTDIKGMVEEPGYYFNKDHADRSEALDNLLLTQGWASYDWKAAFDTAKTPKYEAEAKFRVRGRASDFFGFPIKNTGVMLMSAHPQLLLNTTTDKNGRFMFTDFPLLDTIAFHVQPQKGFNIGLDIDEFVPPAFTPAKYPATPWYVNSDTTMVGYINSTNIRKTEEEKWFNNGKSNLLKTVDIKAKKIEPPPPPLLQLSEEEIRNARTTEKPLTLLGLLEKYIKGGLHPVVIVDGEMVSMAHGPYYDRPEHYLYEYNTEDIKGFSVQKIYNDSMPGGVGITINITSNVGRGGPISGTAGYAYRPMPISWPHRFYSPKYTVKSTAGLKDRRSTIFWAPNIVTNADGKANLSFYSADMPGSYTLIIEGADMNGNVGYSKQQVKIAP